MTIETTYKVLDGAAAAHLRDDAHEFALDVLAGLSEHPKRLSSRWFYDERGSELFSRIMDLPQYYLTDCEAEILETHGDTIATAFGDSPVDVVDLGAGDGRKTSILLNAFQARGVDVRYVPVDISEDAIKGVVERVAGAHPGLPVHGLVSEYTDGLRWLHAQPEQRPRLVLFLGSNIGNFNKPLARSFLRRAWTALADGDRLLIGFDLKKDLDLLLSAYNDPAGVTRDFNLNLLQRINRELRADFDLSKFRHFGTYDVFSGAMASYLVSQERQSVRIGALSQRFEFDAWEPIHTEYSYKYLHSDVDALASSTGFVSEHRFHDRRGWFTDCLWRASKTDAGL